MKRLLFAISLFWRALRHPKEIKDFITEPASHCGGDTSHLQLLALLNHSGRLIDFLKEDISGYSDAQVGAAVRKVHADCSQHLEELVSIQSIFSQQEGATVTIPSGYDPSEVRMIGDVRGTPPFKGQLRHRGWKASKISLPKRSGTFKSDIISPAEVEVTACRGGHDEIS